MRPAITFKTCFLFDLDGTLIDSSEHHAAAFRQVLKQFAPAQLPSFNYEIVKGRATREIFADLGFTNTVDIEKLSTQKQNAYRQSISTVGLRLMPGARGLLDVLSRLKRHLYIVSAGSRRSVEEALRATSIDNYFSGVVTSDEVSESKPEPEIYLKCLTRYQLVASHCIAIEDSESGIAASTGAGIDSIMVNSRTVHSDTCDIFPTLKDFHSFVVEKMQKSA